MALEHYREQVSISVDELAKKTDIPKKSIMQAIESDFPIFKLSELESIANVLYVPAIYLSNDSITYTPNIPQVIDHRNANHASTDNYKYKSCVLEASSARENYLFVLDAMQESAKKFSLQLSGDDAVADAKRIEEYFNLKGQRKEPKHNDYYSSWRNILEASDILVLEKSRTDLDSDGLCLYYETVPVIVIFSTGQAAERRLFTMIHELVHLGLKESVLDGTMTKSSYLTERYCDEVAGHVIASEDIINKYFRKDLSLDEAIKQIRKEVKASRPAIAIQLFITGRITREELNIYLNSLGKVKPTQTKKDIKIPASTLIISHFGKYFVQSVMNAMWHNTISTSTAKEILGIKAHYKPNTLNQVREKVF